MRRIISGITGAVLISVLLMTLSAMDGLRLAQVLKTYENHTYDFRMKLRALQHAAQPIDSITIIDIDQNSILDLGNYKDWPHAHHATLIDVVTSGNPQALMFDIIFDAENHDAYDLIETLWEDHPHKDTELGEQVAEYLELNQPDTFVHATANSRKVYHALVMEPSDSLNFLYRMLKEPAGYDFTKHILELPEEQISRLPHAERLGNNYTSLISAAKRTGSINFPNDLDGVVRRAPTAINFQGPGHVYPSLPLSIVMDVLDIPANGFNYDFDHLVLNLTNRSGQVVRTIPIDEQGRMLIHYYGSFKTFNYLPYSFCMDPDMLDPGYWENRIAIVGSSTPGLMDLKNVPTQESFPGVEIHANVIHGLLKDEIVVPMSQGWGNVMLLILAILVGIVTGYFHRPMVTIPFTLVLGGLWMAFVIQQFIAHLIVWEIVKPLLAITFSFMLGSLYNYLIADKDRRFLKSTFGTYISPELIDKMYVNKQVPTLGGIEGYHTALFLDIQNFSSFSELMSAADLVELLNQFLSELTDILLENNGTLDKYIGDAIVAFYGAPAPVTDHEYRACLTALKMQEQLQLMRARWQSEGQRWPQVVHHMQIRIGLNSGHMVTGNMGSNKRMNYTMMGDTVNIAARLESSAKQYGIGIQAGEKTYEATKDQFEWRFIDLVRVKGKRKPLKVYELLAEKEQLSEDERLMLEHYNRGIDLWNEQSWTAAHAAFEEAEKYEDQYSSRPTTPSRVRMDRCRYLAENPPSADWDGVWELTSK